MQSVYKNILDQIPLEIIKEYCEEKDLPSAPKILTEEEEITLYLKKHVLKFRNPNIQLKKAKQ